MTRLLRSLRRLTRRTLIGFRRPKSSPSAGPLREEQTARFAELYAPFVEPGSLCFDVGAHVGERTDAFLRLGARVVCVEPQPACIRQLRERYSARPGVTIIPHGVAASSGSLMLSVCADADVLSTFSSRWKTGRFRNFDWDDELEVPVETLDELIRRFGVPSFCKVDVEGFEQEVLRGLSRPLPALSFEFTREFLDDANLCVERLQALGMSRFNFVLGEGSDLVLAEWATGDALMARLEGTGDVSMWGDIFARRQSSPSP